jgi:hypothetical protein
MVLSGGEELCPIEEEGKVSASLLFLFCKILSFSSREKGQS